MASKQALTAAERVVMETTFKAAMIRAADIIDRITANDVTTAQFELLRSGSPLEQVAKIDRAVLASTHLRAIAAGGMTKGVKVPDGN